MSAARAVCSVKCVWRLILKAGVFRRFDNGTPCTAVNQPTSRAQNIFRWQSTTHLKPTMTTVDQIGSTGACFHSLWTHGGAEGGRGRKGVAITSRTYRGAPP